MPKPPEKRRTDRIRMSIARRWQTKPHVLRLAKPVVSFHFDDFPVSAADRGAEILRRYDHYGTFYLSTSLYGYKDDAGRYANQATVRKLMGAGHCIGCHTHGHIDLLHSSTDKLDADLRCYEETFRRDFDSPTPKTFAYPYGAMNLRNKRYLAKRFELARGVYGGIDAGKVDLANLRANELADLDTVERASALIEENAAIKGLLIFFTHDVRETPSPFGCKPEHFERVVRDASASGARVLTMDQVADIVTEALTG